MKPKIAQARYSQTSIVLFDPGGEDYLKRFVLFGIDYKVFDPLKDTDYNWSRVLQVLYQEIKLSRSHILRIFFSISAVKSFIRKCKTILIAKQIMDMNPKAVITFIDNSTTFHLVCEQCKDIPFIAIQNGGRYVWCARDACPDPKLRYHIDEYYCFGPQVQRLFERYGHDIKRYIPCGSLVGGYFFGSCQKANTKDKEIFDICLISQWMPHFSDPRRVPPGWARLNDAIIRVTELVACFASEQPVKICVALRRDNQEERNFYNSYFQGRCVFQERDRQNFSSYRAVSISRLGIALNSTLLSEAFGAGKKVLFVNPFNEERLIPTDIEGPWRINAPTYEAFRDRVIELLQMDMEKYQTMAGAAMADSMVFNRDRPAHVVIRERLLELVSKAA